MGDKFYLIYLPFLLYFNCCEEKRNKVSQLLCDI